MHIDARYDGTLPCLFMQSKNQNSNKNVKFATAVKYRFIKLVIRFDTQSLLLCTLLKYDGYEYSTVSHDIYPKSFGLPVGGKAVNPQELTQVSDWGERVQPTPRQPEG